MRWGWEGKERNGQEETALKSESNPQLGRLGKVTYVKDRLTGEVVAMKHVAPARRDRLEYELQLLVLGKKIGLPAPKPVENQLLQYVDDQGNLQGYSLPMEHLGPPTYISLQEWIGQRRGHGWTSEQALRELIPTMYRVAKAIDTAHEFQFVHGDLCPQHLMLPQKKKKSVRIIDWNSAQHPQIKQYPKGTWLFAKRPYLDPYLVENQFRILPDQASDLYSAACIFYEMITGQEYQFLPKKGAIDPVATTAIYNEKKYYAQAADHCLRGLTPVHNTLMSFLVANRKQRVIVSATAMVDAIKSDFQYIKDYGSGPRG